MVVFTLLRYSEWYILKISVKKPFFYMTDYNSSDILLDTLKMNILYVDEQKEGLMKMENGNYEGNVETSLEPERDFYGQQKKKKSFSSLFTVKYIVIAAISLIVIIGGVFTIRAAGNTYKAPVANMKMQYANRDWSANRFRKYYQKMSNGFGTKEMKSIWKDIEKWEEAEDFWEEKVDSWNDNLENDRDEYGSNYRLKITIDDKEELEKDDIKKYRSYIKDLGDDIIDIVDDYDTDDWEEIADEMGMSKSEAKQLYRDIRDWGRQLKKATVSEGYELDLIITVNGDELDEPEEIEKIIKVYRVNGRWVDESYTSIYYHSVLMCLPRLKWYVR